MIIDSLLQTDFYSYSVGQIFALRFSDLSAKYKLIIRSPVDWPPMMLQKVYREVQACGELRLTDDECAFVAQQNIFKPIFLDWLSKTRLLNPDYVKFDGMNISIEGPLYVCIYWEIPLLAIISELYHAASPQKKESLPCQKVYALDEVGVPWADFGTRRRFSRAYHEAVIEVAAWSPQVKNFVGTSNLALAKKYDLKPIGTFSHQGPQAMQVVYGLEDSNNGWGMEWQSLYEDNLNVFLPDTLTTDYAIKTMDNFLVAWDMTRQDSGEPKEYVDKMLNLYHQHKVDPKTKTIVFSDGLTPDKLRDIKEYVAGRINISAGCGTWLTNPSSTPLNAVIKLVEVNNQPVVKISDSPGKATGTPEAIKKAMETIDKACH